MWSITKNLFKLLAKWQPEEVEASRQDVLLSTLITYINQSSLNMRSLRLAKVPQSFFDQRELTAKDRGSFGVVPLITRFGDWVVDVPGYKPSFS